MTEAEWLACTDSTPLLVFLRGMRSERKMLLYVVACFRRVLNLLAVNPEGRLSLAERARDVDVTERHADGFSFKEEADEARRRAMQEALCGMYGAANAA